MSAWQSQMAGPDSAVWDKALDTFSSNTMEKFNRHVLPSINGNFTATGGRKSSRAGVTEGIALKGAMDSIADYSANLNLGYHNMANKNQQFGLGVTPNKDDLERNNNLL